VSAPAIREHAARARSSLLSDRQMIGPVILVAGPWLAAVAALVIVGVRLLPQIGLGALEDLRLAVVYAFMLAPLSAAPTAVVATRSLALGPGMGAVLALALCASGAGAVFLVMLVSLSLGLMGSALWPGFLMLTSSSAMVLTAMPVLAARRSELLALRSFAVGMGCAVLISRSLATGQVSGASVLWAFSAGNALCLVICLLRHGAGAAAPGALREAAQALLRAAGRSWPYALAAGCAVAGVWADKWVNWLGPTGAVTRSGFLHAPGYDGAMFLAHLSALPALIALAAFQAGPLTRAKEDFRTGLTRGATLVSLEAQARFTSGLLWRGLLRIFVLQVAIVAALVLMSPLMAEIAGFRLDQLLLLRLGFPATFLHSLFLGLAGILSLTNDKMRFALLSVLFLVLNLVLTAWSLGQVGVSPLGFQLAALISILIAAPVALSSMRTFVRRHFLDGNDSLFSE